MKICVTGGRGKTSLIKRIMLNEFSLQYKPTTFIEIYHFGPVEIYEIPNTEHRKSMKCDLLLVVCRSQLDIIDKMKEWFGLAKITLIIRIGEELAVEEAFLCPKERLFRVSNLSCDGMKELRSEIQLHINRHLYT